MSLTTPSKIPELQIKLYRKAKNEPGYRLLHAVRQGFRIPAESRFSKRILNRMPIRFARP